MALLARRMQRQLGRELGRARQRRERLQRLECLGDVDALKL